MRFPSARAAGCALFFLMLTVPTVYQPLKGALLAFVIAGILARILMRDRIALHPAIASGAAAFVTIGLLFLLRGIWFGNPGAFRMSGVYVFWPVIYTLLLTEASDTRELTTISRVLFAALFTICVYSLTYVLWEAGWWPDMLYVPLRQGQEVSFRAGVVEFRLYSLASLLFLVPYAIAALIAWPRGGPLRRATLWFGVALGVTVTLLSGRRGLMLVVAISPVLTFAMLWFALRRRHRRRLPIVRAATAGCAVLLIAAGLLHWTQGFEPAALIRDFSKGFAFDTDPVAMSRASQFWQLTQAWLRTPILGAGYGAVIHGFVRSAEMPWAFELSYLALLFNVGLLGMLAYAAGVAAIFAAGVRLVASDHPLARQVLPVLVGSAAFLIATATNPYLFKFDYLWVVFLPLAFVNGWLLDTSRTTAPSTCA